MLAAQLLKREQVLSPEAIHVRFMPSRRCYPCGRAASLCLQGERNEDYFYARDSLINDSLRQ